MSMEIIESFRASADCEQVMISARPELVEGYERCCKNLRFSLFILFLLTATSCLTATQYVFTAQNSTPTVSSSFGAPEAIFCNTDLTIDTSGGSSYFTGYVHSNGNISTTGADLRVDSVGRIMGTITESAEFEIALKNDLLCGPRFSWSGSPFQLYTQDTNPATVQLSGDLGINNGVSNQTLIINNGLILITIDGNGNTITLGSNAIEILSPLVLRNMNIVINGTVSGNAYPFEPAASGGTLTLQDVNIFLDPVLGGTPAKFFNTGSGSAPLIIKGMVTVSGQGQTLDLNVNSSSGPSSSAIYIDDNATLKINQGVTLKVSTDITSINKKIYLKGTSSILHLDGCTLWVPVAGLTTPGLQLERGMAMFENRVNIDNEANTDANKGLILGDGSSASNDVKLVFGGDAQLVVDGFFFHRPA